MYRPNKKWLLVGVLLTALVAVGASPAQAQWWWGSQAALYGCGCFNTCFGCWNTCASGCHGGWYGGWYDGCGGGCGPWGGWGGCGYGWGDCGGWGGGGWGGRGLFRHAGWRSGGWGGCGWSDCCAPVCGAPAYGAMGYCDTPVEPYAAAPMTTPQTPTPPVPPTPPAPQPSTSPSMTPPPPAPQLPGAPEAPPAGTPNIPSPTTLLDRESGLLVIQVPEDARVIINGLVTKSTGSIRQYASHGLKPGFSYKYDVRVEVVRDGKAISDQRTVELTAGAQQNVAFAMNAHGAAPQVAAAW